MNRSERYLSNNGIKDISQVNIVEIMEDYRHEIQLEFYQVFDILQEELDSGCEIIKQEVRVRM